MFLSLEGLNDCDSHSDLCAGDGSWPLFAAVPRTAEPGFKAAFKLSEKGRWQATDHRWLDHWGKIKIISWEFHTANQSGHHLCIIKYLCVSLCHYDFDSKKTPWSWTDKPVHGRWRDLLCSSACAHLRQILLGGNVRVMPVMVRQLQRLFEPGAGWNGCNAEAHPSGWKVAKSAGPHPIWAYPDITWPCKGSELTKCLHSWCDREACARYCTNKAVVESMVFQSSL